MTKKHPTQKTPVTTATTTTVPTTAILTPTPTPTPSKPSKSPKLAKPTTPASSSASATLSTPRLPTTPTSLPQQKLASHTLFGVALPPKALVPYGLQVTYGIGKTRALAICHQLGISECTRCGERAPEHIPMLTALIPKMGYVIGSDRRRLEAQTLQRYVSLNTVKGIRMRLGFPVHGQRTRTNAKTARKLNAARVRSSSQAKS